MDSGIGDRSAKNQISNSNGSSRDLFTNPVMFLNSLQTPTKTVSRGLMVVPKENFKNLASENDTFLKDFITKVVKK